MKGILSDIQKPAVISTEMIDYQKNDYIVPAVKECYAEMYEIIDNKKLTTIKAIAANKDIKSINDKLNKMLTERFGVGFQHTFVDFDNFAIYPVVPAQKNVLNDSAEYFKEYFEKYKSMYDENPTDEEVYGSAALKGFDDTIETRLYHNFEKMQEAFNTDGVHIDLKKAKITGLSKDFKLLIMGDILFMKNIDITPDELTGILFHEIGHGFTHIEYSVRTAKNTSVLVDTIREDLIKKNKSQKEVITSIVNKLDIQDKVDEKASVLTKFLIALKEAFSPSKDNTIISDYSNIDSEQLADQFAGRFGLSAEAARGLYKMYDKFGQTGFDLQKMLINIFTSPLTYINILIFILSGLSLLVANGITALGILALTLNSTMTIVIMSLITILAGTITAAMFNITEVYDNPKHRITRVKLEMVRLLRRSKADKKLTKQILDNLESVEKIISDIKIDHRALNDNPILKFLATPYRALSKDYELKRLDQDIEMLMENDLHVAAAKLRNN